MKFDLDSLDTKSLSDTGVDMVIHQFGTTEPLVARNGGTVSLKLLGPDSDKYRTFTRVQVQKRLQKNSEIRLFVPNLEEAEADSLDMLAACTVGWANVLDREGVEIPFSSESARILYVNYPVVREQADLFVVTRANFLKAPSGS